MMNTTGCIMGGWLAVSSRQILKDHGLVYENGIITDVAPNGKLMGKPRIIDARDHIICPSFVNTHTHMYAVTGRGAAQPDLTLIPLLKEFWWPEVEDRQTIETIRVSTEYACLQHLRSGIGLINDTLEAPLAKKNERLKTEAGIIQKTGMKAVLSLESSERIHEENGWDCIMENSEFIKAQQASQAGQGDIRGTICAHTTFSSSAAFLKKAAALAVSQKAMLQIHMNEGADEGQYCMRQYGLTPGQFYKRIGFWDGAVPLFVNQCSVIEPVDFAILREFDAGVSTQPHSNALSGSGIAPVPELLQCGVKMGIGSDTGDGNFFEEMRYLMILQKGKHHSRSIMPAETVFDMATEMGASALGFLDTGALTAGKKADYLVICGDTPVPLRKDHIIHELIWEKNPRDIKAMYINGVEICREGEPVFLDSQKVREEYSALMIDFWKHQPITS
jgi:cytosine/adenosine deaminase-related metal-dependent hydrolase